MSKFQPGNPGRRPGSRNKLQAAFVTAMQTDFDEHGVDVIKIVRAEKPDVYLKVLASILPKEMLFNGDVVEDMTDEELKDSLAALQKLKAVA